MKKVWKGMVCGMVAVMFLMPVNIAIQGKYDEIATQNTNNQVHVIYSFCKPTIKTIEIAGTYYDRVIAPGLIPAGNPGEPMIPAKGAYILLPPNSKDRSIHITPSGEQAIRFNLSIAPIPKPIPLLPKNCSSIPTPDETIYGSNSLYPGKLYTKVGTYVFRGYQILVLLLYPIQYNPVTDELFYYKNLEVSIKTTIGDSLMDLFRGLEKDENEVMKKVDNPDDIEWYQKEKTNLPSLDQKYEILILTTEELKHGFELLKQAHYDHGDTCVIKTLANVGIRKNPENIRNYIKNAYSEWGIDYVLIGGDDDLIPAPILWVEGMDEEKWHYETFMPSDLYYACLDGPFNSDGDDKWGEPTDGENGGDVDLMAEVYVGRACVDNADDVDNFVTKTISYMNKARGVDDYLNKVCLAGEYQGDYGIATWGGNYLDQLIDGSTADGYTTIGIPSDEYNIDKLYDRDWPSWDPNDPWNTGWPKLELAKRMNSDLHIISHCGHAYYGYNMKMFNDDVFSLINSNEPFFVWSDGCMSGGFDNPEGYDCFAEYFTVKSNSGAFAGIWNARYGFFWSYSTDGDSQRYQREFWDAVFGENIPVIGKANQDSREDNLHIIGRSCMRWVYYELNLFGDPLVSFHVSNPPNKPAKPSGETNGKVGEEYTYNSSTTDPDGDQIYYKWDWGDGTYSEWLGPYDPGEVCKICHVWENKGGYSIRVKTKDQYEERSPWSDPLVVSMPKSYQNPIVTLLEKINEWFVSTFGREILPEISNL
jgi:hypothetical protein